MSRNESTENGGGAEKAKSILKSTEKSGSNFPPFRVDLRYRNTLPDIPFDPYFLDVPLAADFLWGFRQSTLEKNYKYRIHMNPPHLMDDMIDPLGAEEWAKAAVFDEKDKALQRKEGADAKSTKNVRSNREAKTWMLKTTYTRENVHRYNEPSSQNDEFGDDGFNASVEDEDSDARVSKIKKQFEIANSGRLPTDIPPGKKIKRILPFLPLRALREIDLHLVRYKPGERIMRDNARGDSDDQKIVKRALLVRRKDADETETKRNMFTPLSVFLPKSADRKRANFDDSGDEDELLDDEDTSAKKKKDSDDEDDDELFGDDDEEKEKESSKKKKKKAQKNDDDDDDELFGGDEDAEKKEDVPEDTTVEYIREYQAQIINAKKSNDRVAIVFEDKVARYVELEPESLRLFRIKQPGDRDRVHEESNVQVIRKVDPKDGEAVDDENLILSAEERRARIKRRRAIEGGDLDLV